MADRVYRRRVRTRAAVARDREATSDAATLMARGGVASGLELRNIAVSYGDLVALDDCSLTVIADKLRRPPSDDFRVIVMLPDKANNGADDTRGQLALLAEADGDQRRFLATTIRARSGNTSDRVYVHAKVGIVDDRWLTLGSANLNAHSFYNDSEVNLITCDAALARDTRLRLWAAHLERDIDEVAGDPRSVIDELWRPIAAEQRQRRDRGELLTHGLVELPATSRRSERLLGPLQSLLVDG